MRRYSVSTTIKSSGDGEVATVAGEGCRWKLLVTTLQVVGPGVTVVWSSTLESRCQMYPAKDVRAALFRGSTALSEWRREDKRIPKKS